ncbi:UNVERIFIED_CONTAM: hypothetical protein FKN15_042918 [Acipenser sinensis]
MSAMPRKMDEFLQIAPHSLAIVLSRTGAEDLPVVREKLQQHHTGYEIFADFKAENMQHFWNKKVTDAVPETFFLGWIDDRVLLIQGKEDHLEVLREGWMRRSLKPPRGFEIRYLELKKRLRYSSRLLQGHCYRRALSQSVCVYIQEGSVRSAGSTTMEPLNCKTVPVKMIAQPGLSERPGVAGRPGLQK